MKNLLCTNPTIILNRHAKDLILKHGNYTLRGEYIQLSMYEKSLWSYTFPWRKFGTRILNITREDIDTCYITDFENGELIPLYIEVACGKCVLCRDKKARDWSTRAMCESQVSSGHPYFITLTYNDYFKPSGGLNIKHCQDFMKRLRINAERYFNRTDLNLRFFLCGEYGHHYHRPHYHLLLWNFPLVDNIKRLVDIVQKSWSFVIRASKVDNWNPRDVFFDEKAKRYRVQFGFVHIRKASGNHIKYSMKYMRKDCVIPKGQSDTFYLASRRRGIGYGWLEKHKEEIINNPHYNEVEFTDIWSDKRFKGSLPRYFKDIMFPSCSKYIPKAIRDKFGQYVHLINVRNSILNKRILYTPELRIFAKYNPLYAYITDVPLANYSQPYMMELDEDYSYYVPETKEGYLVNIARVQGLCPDSPDVKVNKLFKHVVNQIDELEKELQNYEIDVPYYENMQAQKNHHNYYLAKEINASPSVNVNDMAWSISRTNRIRQHSELF